MTKTAAAILAALLISAQPLPPPTDDFTVECVLLEGMDACQPGSVVIEEGTPLLPFVSVAMAAGFDRIERDDTGGISVSSPQRQVTASPILEYLTADGHYIWLGSPPTADMDELLLPIDPLCAALGLRWRWEDGIIELSQAAQPIEWEDYDPHLLLWLARVVWAEARGECLKGQVAVAQVVLNRMASPYYPDTVTEVLFQPYQFSTASSGAIWNSANEDCYLAARIALDGADIVGGDCLYFNSCPGYTRGLTYICTIGGHKFYSP